MLQGLFLLAGGLLPLARPLEASVAAWVLQVVLLPLSVVTAWSVDLCNILSCKRLHIRSFLDLKRDAPSHPSSRVTGHLSPSSTKPPTVSREFASLFALLKNSLCLCICARTHTGTLVFAVAALHLQPVVSGVVCVLT